MRKKILSVVFWCLWAALVVASITGAGVLIYLLCTIAL